MAITVDQATMNDINERQVYWQDIADNYSAQIDNLEQQKAAAQALADGLEIIAAELTLE